MYAIWLVFLVDDFLAHTISHQQIIVYCFAIIFAYSWDICYQLSIDTSSKEEYKQLKSIFKDKISKYDNIIVYEISAIEISVSLATIITASIFHTIYPEWKYVRYMYCIFVVINMILDILYDYMNHGESNA